jgi:DNA-directed RNA polymerase I subunit RPA1
MYLQLYGFTCGLDDLVLTKDFNKKRRMLIEKCHKEGVEAAAEFCSLKNF